MNINITQKDADSVSNAGNVILYVGIAMIVAEIPRMYYLCKLCGFVCCGGKTRDTVADREGIVMAMKALILNQALSAILIIVIVLATGGNLGNFVQIILNFVVNMLFAFWWIMDLNKWVDSKKAMSA
jgi:hypothetical protein